MMNRIKKSGVIFIALASMLFGSQAFAGIHIEPFFGYAFSGKSKMKFTFEGRTVEGEGDYTGTLFGGRLGYSTFGFLVAAEYETGTSKDDDGDSSPMTNIGLTLGYTFPILLRVYATYQPTSKIEIPEKRSGRTVTQEKGSMTGKGTKIGVGYTGFPIVALNFEMSSLTYDKIEFGGGDYDIDSKNTHYAINLSFPFNF